jgi:hypothetical protein
VLSATASEESQSSHGVKCRMLPCLADDFDS